MAIVKCKSCGGDVSKLATACPHCGHPNEVQRGVDGIMSLVWLACLGFGAWWWFGGGFDNQVAKDMNKIEYQVAADYVTQYDIAKRQGELMQACSLAGIVSSAYLNAKDEAKYQQWNEIKKLDCKKARASH